MKINIPLLIKCILIPLVVGAISAFLSSDAMMAFDLLNKPALSPPAWLFPVVWTILYTLMGISSYLVLVSDADREEIQNALKIYALQLVVNFLWPTFFFNFQWYLFAFVWLVLLWVLVFIMIWRFKGVSKLAAYLNVSYLLWLTLAGYLNFSIWLLNR